MSRNKNTKDKHKKYYINVLEAIERGFQVDLNVAMTCFLVVNTGIPFPVVHPGSDVAVPGFLAAHFFRIYTFISVSRLN